MYGKSPYYKTAREQQSEDFRDAIEAEFRKNETGTRKGVRVLHDGTIEHYVERV